MEQKKFEENLREAAVSHRKEGELYLPPGTRTGNWPLCNTCHKEVDAVELRDVTRKSVEIWTSCHGKEDYYKLVFPFTLDDDPLSDERANWAIKRALQDIVVFKPTHKEKSPGLIIL